MLTTKVGMVILVVHALLVELVGKYYFPWGYARMVTQVIFMLCCTHLVNVIGIIKDKFII